MRYASDSFTEKLMNRQIEYGLIPRGPGFSYKLSGVTNNSNLYASIIALLSKLDVTADIKFTMWPLVRQSSLGDGLWLMLS